MQGSFTVPRSLLEEVGPLLLERQTGQNLALEIESPQEENIILEAGAGGVPVPATPAPVSSSLSSSSLATASSSSSVPPALDWKKVPTISLNAALALHATGMNASDEENDAYARAQSRQRTFLDVTELPTADVANQRDEKSRASRKLPVLAPTGTLPPLHALDKELFAAVSRADLVTVRRVLGIKAHSSGSSGPADNNNHQRTRDEKAATPLAANQESRDSADVLAVHPESGANVMHLAAASWEATSENSRASLLTCLVSTTSLHATSDTLLQLRFMDKMCFKASLRTHAFAIAFLAFVGSRLRVRAYDVEFPSVCALIHRRWTSAAQGACSTPEPLTDRLRSTGPLAWGTWTR